MVKPDPYKMLAWKLYNRLNVVQFRKVLEDESYITELVLEELWDTDFNGVFLDTVFIDMKLLRDREKINPEMKALAEAIVKRLDQERLRQAVAEIAS